ncbi:MAG: phosphate acyltransferase, partial [Nitratireductor sp.]
PNSKFEGRANVLVFANSETASAVKNSFKTIANGIEVGPILMGMGNRAHIVNPSITTRGLINIAALAGTPVSNYA